MHSVDTWYHYVNDNFAIWPYGDGVLTFEVLELYSLTHLVENGKELLGNYHIEIFGEQERQ